MWIQVSVNDAHGVQVSLEQKKTLLRVSKQIYPFTFTNISNRVLAAWQDPQPLNHHPTEAANPDPGALPSDAGTVWLTIPEAIPLAKLTFCCQGNGSWKTSPHQSGTVLPTIWWQLLLLYRDSYRSQKTVIQLQQKGTSCSSLPTAKKKLFHTVPQENTINKHHKAGTPTVCCQPHATISRGLPGFPSACAHRIAEEVLQGATLDVLSEEIELLVLVKYTNELQHIGVIQAAHHFHLGNRDTSQSMNEATPGKSSVHLYCSCPTEDSIPILEVTSRHQSALNP